MSTSRENPSKYVADMDKILGRDKQDIKGTTKQMKAPTHKRHISQEAALELTRLANVRFGLEQSYRELLASLGVPPEHVKSIIDCAKARNMKRARKMTQLYGNYTPAHVIDNSILPPLFYETEL